MSARVVVWDPLGEHLEGEVISGTTVKLIARGPELVMLPVEPELLGRCGCAGWVKRSFGVGVEFGSSPRFGCSTVLYAVPGCPVIRWVARVVPVPAVGGAKMPSGFLKLAGESGKPYSLSGGIVSGDNPVRLDAVEPDEHGGWTIGGSAKAAVMTEGFVALGLYGALEGGRVVWLAVSQSR